MKVYLAGPMRGYPDWNFAAFDTAREAWAAAGHRVFCPAALFRALPYTKEEPAIDRTHLNHVIQADLACLYAADAIALLEGWERSTGVTVELAMAQFLGLPIYNAVTMERLTVKGTPWTPPEKDGDWAEVWRTSVDRCIAREQQTQGAK